MITLSGLRPVSYAITPEGIQELKRQLEELRRRCQEAVEEIREDSSQSTDLGSRVDSTFAANHNQSQELAIQIDLLERIIERAEVISTPQGSEKVELGSTVTVRLDGGQRSYRLVGVIEADPAEGRISDASPFGRSLLGRRVNDTVEITAPGNRVTATIVGIG